ncbi:AAA domain-containing protein [Maridesulfovibrio ferrireducens]|uniref:AAA domain-containing protein n=1 Tax=Maridesulfovibrio ferrireducens TaxID=246191 RepID=UPI001A28E4DE|nr:AAA domain-containing protein [Maridesulfovibrio ferrireducens]MBI9109945.1 DUF559 domain-containing protein [Maridesulfovibrio ferrireducens]
MHTNIETEIYNSLQKSALGQRTLDLRRYLNLSKINISKLQLLRELKRLQKSGDISYKLGRWSLVDFKNNPNLQKKNIELNTLNISEISRAILNLEKKHSNKIDTDDSCQIHGKWSLFRELLSYYQKCLCSEEGAEASAFQNQLNTNFIYLKKNSLQLFSSTNNLAVPLGPHLGEFVRTIFSNKDIMPLVVGYPVQAISIEKEGEPTTSIIQPIFLHTVTFSISSGGIHTSTTTGAPQINLKWLENVFPRNIKLRQSFLSACRLLNSDKNECADFKELVGILSTFASNKIIEPLNVESVNEEALSEPFKTGIYNKAVLMVAKRTRYTATLLKELAYIEKAPDHELDKTALNSIFTDGKIENTNHNATEKIGHRILEFPTLNPAQFKAVKSALNVKVSVITGPPGTGKSQVVAATIINSRLRNKSVLFTSRNHKAIDAVVSRLSSEDGLSLIVRANSKEDPNLKYTFEHSIREMLSECYDASVVENWNLILEELDSFIEKKEIGLAQIQKISLLTERLGELEERKDVLALDIVPETLVSLNKYAKSFPTISFKKISDSLSRLDSFNESFLQKKKLLWKRFVLLPDLFKCNQKLKLFNKLALPTFPRNKSQLPEFKDQILKVISCADYSLLTKKTERIELELLALPSFEECAASLRKIDEIISKKSLKVIKYESLSRIGTPPSISREELLGLKGALKSVKTGCAGRYLESETKRVLHERVPYILEAFPAWAVTNLSIGSRIPLAAGIFDLAIIDEASQSDIISAIPVLFRAKRATVVGDPFQLNHTSRLSTEKDTLLRKDVGILKVEDIRYSYTESSLYDLVAGADNINPVFLSETFRSCQDIADYSNQAFYSGRLKVATNPTGLIVPQGMRLGIHWKNLSGEIQRASGGGCICLTEAQEVKKIVSQIIEENKFNGTIGVVTPFRQQANRINDILFDGDIDYGLAQKAKLHVDTAHGFQGDERDVMIMSLCSGAEMPQGSLNFIRENGYLFNVAASRSRAVLYVVGDRTWAKSCGIPHIVKLAQEKNISPNVIKGPWAPYESPWEKIFAEALQKVGLNPITQVPVGYRRLDLALIRKGTNPFKIDIEVDGDCHRNSDGSRKMDDYWRDIQVQSAGFIVLRFWVYQLRDDLHGCVQKVLKVWSNNE